MPFTLSNIPAVNSLPDEAAVMTRQEINGSNKGRWVPLETLATKVAELAGINVASVSAIEGGIRIEYIDGTTEDIAISASSGLAFDRIYWDEDTGLLHIMLDGEDVVDPTHVGGSGGGSGGSDLTFALYTSPTTSVAENSGVANAEFKFTSFDKDTSEATGSGTLKITVGGVVKANIPVQQGDHQIVNLFQYLSSGTNEVKLTLTDSYGTPATRKLTYVVESFSIAWSLASVQTNTEGSLSFYITPTGNGAKTIYTYVDGTLHSTDTVSNSGRRSTKTISGLAHGAHTIEVYGVMTVQGTSLESNHLKAAVAQIVEGQTGVVVAVNWPSGTLTQFSAVPIPYLVYDPSGSPATVELHEGNTKVNELSADRTPHTWTYRPAQSGSVTAKVQCGAVSSSHTYSVEAIEIHATEVTDGLVCKVNPGSMSSLQSWSYGGYSFTLSQGFDLVNGGIVTDGDGVPCIRITAGDTLTLNFDPFTSGVTRTGMEMKLIYKIANTSSKTAVGISSMNNNRGLRVQANNVYLMGNQSTVELSVCENEKTELDVTIQQSGASSNRLMSLWERCSTFAMAQYAVDESFEHAQSVGITFGCPEADVYLYFFRAYSRDLTTAELKANYIVDGPSGEEIYARDTRNNIYDNGSVNFELAAQANPKASFILLNAEKVSTAKKKNGGTVSGTIRYIQAGGGAAHAFTAFLNMDLQGTSSEEHALTAGPNLNLRMPNGIAFDSDPDNLAAGYAMHGAENSIAVNLFNYKKNIASQDHIVNRLCAEWYNRFQPSVRQARTADPRVRDCLESTMCAVFFHNTGNAAVQVGPDLVQPNETIFFGLGNLCSSKDCFETFEYDDIVIEVKNNTEDQVRFKSKDLTGDNFDNNYEFRYLNEDAYTEEEAKAEWQTVQDFIYDTDYTAATDEPLSTPAVIDGVTYGFDTAEYRMAKWKAEAPAIFDMDTLYWHHVVTLFLLLRDNRGKNMFWSKSKTTGKWGLWFDWDNDTGLGRNNRGYVDIEPGYMDFDTLGTSDVFNAADNALFTTLRQCNFADLRAMYVDRERAGAWNIDDLLAYIKESQEQLCESLWIEDAEHNAIRILENLGNSSYLARATGKLQLHLEKTLRFQKALVDSYFTSSDSTTDRARLRGNTPSEYSGIAPSGQITLTPYTNMYINILAGSTSYRQRAYEGVPVTFDISANLNDTEMYLYSAEWIQGLGNLAALYLSQFEIGTMKRVRQIALGSAEDGYHNDSVMSLSFANCVKLEQLNLAGLPNTAVALDFTNNIYLKEIDTRNSGITGLRFAKNGRLETARLNALTSIYVSGLRSLDTFSMAAYTSLGAITFENSAVGTMAIVSSATNLERVRLLGINWTLESASLLRRLAGLKGFGDDGSPIDDPVVTGTAHIDMVSSDDLAYLGAVFPNLEITYTSLIPSYTVTFKGADGTTTVDTQSVSQGSAPAEPTTRETSPIPVPTKAPNTQYKYTFDGWSWTQDGAVIEDLSELSIVQNTTLYAHFVREVQTYRVRWYNLNTLLETQTGEYGACLTPTCAKPQNPNNGQYGLYYINKGWDKSTGFLTEDLDVHAVYAQATAPSGKTFAQLTPAEIKALIAADVLSPTGENNNVIYSGDTAAIRAGHDFNFDNVESHELIPLAGPRTFDGSTYFKPQIDGEDILLWDGDRSFTLAIDMAYDTASDAGGCLASCYQNNGFLLRYNSGGSVRYGSAVAQAVSSGGYRQMVVIRHKKGDPKLYVYASNKNDNAIISTALEQSSQPDHDAPLCFGAQMANDGYLDSYGKGTVYWAKLWLDDLGDSVCQQIAQWPRQEFVMMAVGSGEHAFRDFVRVDNNRYVNCSVLLTELLEETHKMNETSTNVGGWKDSGMRLWANTRIFAALPVEWQELILTVYVHSSAGGGNNNTAIVDPPAEDRIWIPSMKQMGFQTGTAPYSNEAEAVFTPFTNDASRIKHLNLGAGAASVWWLRSPHPSGAALFYYITASGGSNHIGASSACGVAFGFSF